MDHEPVAAYHRLAYRLQLAKCWLIVIAIAALVIGLAAWCDCFWDVS
jgi:hypothetical protein